MSPLLQSRLQSRGERIQPWAKDTILCSCTYAVHPPFPLLHNFKNCRGTDHETCAEREILGSPSMTRFSASDPGESRTRPQPRFPDVLGAEKTNLPLGYYPNGNPPQCCPGRTGLPGLRASAPGAFRSYTPQGPSPKTPHPFKRKYILYHTMKETERETPARGNLPCGFSFIPFALLRRQLKINLANGRSGATMLCRRSLIHHRTMRAPRRGIRSGDEALQVIGSVEDNKIGRSARCDAVAIPGRPWSRRSCP